MKITKQTKKISFVDGKKVEWVLAHYESGITVAYQNGKIMDKEIAVQIRDLSDATYTFTCMCIRRQELLVLN